MLKSPSEAQAHLDKAQRLIVVIVNYRTPELSIDCLNSLSVQVPALEGVHVAIVDNGSGDGSAEKIRQAIETKGWQSWVTLMPQDVNWGFAGGNNRALEAFPQFQYALLLNSDTVVHDNCLAYCLTVMDAEPSIGVMSCKLLNPDGSAQTTARKFPTPLRAAIAALGLPWRLPNLFSWANIQDETWDRQIVKRDVDWLGGAFLFVRGEVLQKIGLLDEDFFFYGEDIEFNYRIHKAGYRRCYDPAVSITHFGGGSSDPERLCRVRRQTSFWKAWYLVQHKCYGWWAASLLRAVDLGIWGARLLAFGSLRNRHEKYQEALAMWQLLSKPLKVT